MLACVCRLEWGSNYKFHIDSILLDSVEFFAYKIEILVILVGVPTEKGRIRTMFSDKLVM